MKVRLQPLLILHSLLLLQLATAFVPLSNLQTYTQIQKPSFGNLLAPRHFLTKHQQAAVASPRPSTDVFSARSTTALSTTSPNTAATVTAATSIPSSEETKPPMSKIAKKLTKAGMVAFITTVALGLITSLSVIRVSGSIGVPEKRRQKWALSIGQFWARWSLRLFPFCKVKVIVDEDDPYRKTPEPCVWVCNHMSMLDVFLLLASDLRMRGKNKRPIKIVYWKQLESNPFTKILFQQSGFIPIDMAANNPGETNEYDKKSFKAFLKESKQAFEDGFDIGVLPEGQLNPAPENGLMPLFSGAYTLARMSRRPIQMLALHGVNQLWHPNDGFEVGDMNVTGRQVKIRVYPSHGRRYESNEEFAETFTAVVGHFGKYGIDRPDVYEWLDGRKWKEIEQKRRQAEEKEMLKRQLQTPDEEEQQRSAELEVQEGKGRHSSA